MGDTNSDVIDVAKKIDEEKETVLEIRMLPDGSVKWHIPPDIHKACYMIEILNTVFRNVLASTLMVKKPIIQKPGIIIPGKK
jgi:hypothetical protein